MELWLAIKFILGNKRKMIFPFMSVLVGIMSLVITLSLSKGGEELINNSLSSLGENRILIGEDVLTKYDMEIIESYPFVQYALFPQGRIKEEGNIFIAYSKKALNKLNLNYLKDNEVIIDKNQYPKKEIGDIISFKINDQRREFYVKDIYQEKNPFELMKKGNRIIISQENFEKLFNKRIYNSMIISFYENENPEDYAGPLINKLKENTFGKSNLKLLETPKVYKKIIKIKKMVKITLSIISIISLSLGAFGILNLIGNNIKARSKHLGILRAMGMSKRRIVKVFLFEASIIALIGSLLGIILGILGSYLIGKLINIYPVFNITQILISLLLSIGIGITMGMYPTKKINKESVVKILKGD